MKRSWMILAVALAACSDDKPAVTQVDASVDASAMMDVGDTGVMDFWDMNPACYHSEQPPTVPAIRVPRWAFEPWISKDISDGADTYAFVEGFKSRNIPVGVVVLDSPWETHYNTFIPNPERYPNFEQMVSDLKDQDVRVVLWVTQMVNEIGLDLEQGGDVYVGPASNYLEGKTCNYYVDDGKTYNWWKGRGAGVDFSDPGARAWWHAQQDVLLDMGVAGWKLDFGESYIRRDTIKTDAGVVPHQTYSEAYYQDFWEHGASKYGTDDFLTMVRGYDKSYDFEGRFFAKREHAPVVWAGDNRRDWVGLEDALDHMFRSAAAGYVVVGSDLGGYMDRDDVDLGILIPADRTNFLRWTAASALSPFMQLHGRANLTPWTFPNDPDPDETVDIYRLWSTFHSELVPFMYALSEEGFKDFTPVLRPVGEPATWPGDYRYTLGDALLVAPILDDTGVRQVEFPAGNWLDLWSGQAFSGSLSFDISSSMRRALIFAREGSIIPMNISTLATNLGGPDLANTLTVLVFPSTTSATFTLHESTPAQISAVIDTGVISVEVPANDQPIWLRVWAPTATTVQVDGVERLPQPTRALAGDTGFAKIDDFVWVKLDGAASVEIR